jgi:NAD(P)-dependent dehydrogenase (short-subunit alcohol dehydrogenase family)
MGRLDGKVAVITGAGGGMGREAALLFSDEGAQVCVADVDSDAAERTATEARDAFAVGVDVAEPDSVRARYAAAAARYGGIDVLYNNAGISPADDASILETEPDAWQRVQDVNTKGVYLCCKHGIPYLLERGGGSVINVASFVALVGAATSQISYTASKGAVLSMSRELGVQFARQGVRVNALCPGPVETPLLLRIFGDDPAAYERRRIHLPMGRLAKPREIVNAALFLASDESSYVNGATFLVDGGLTAAYVTPEWRARSCRSARPRPCARGRRAPRRAGRRSPPPASPCRS